MFGEWGGLVMQNNNCEQYNNDCFNIIHYILASWNCNNNKTFEFISASLLYWT